jgi:hypothetical protein
MNIPFLKQLLSIISKRKSLDVLVKKGYSYSQIGQILLEAVTDNYLVYNDTKYILTEKGAKILKKEKPFEIIKTLDEYRIKKISIDEVFIPKYTKGEFER